MSVGNGAVSGGQESNNAWALGARALIGSGRIERLAIYLPLASAMTESCAAIRLSEPWAACW